MAGPGIPVAQLHRGADGERAGGASDLPTPEERMAATQAHQAAATHPSAGPARRPSGPSLYIGIFVIVLAALSAILLALDH